MPLSCENSHLLVPTRSRSSKVKVVVVPKNGTLFLEPVESVPILKSSKKSPKSGSDFGLRFSRNLAPSPVNFLNPQIGNKTVENRPWEKYVDRHASNAEKGHQDAEGVGLGLDYPRCRGSLGRYEMSHAPKTEQSELSLFSLRLQCLCGAERALKESGAEQSVLRQIPPIGCGGWV